MPELQTHSRLMAISRNEFLRVLSAMLRPGECMEVMAYGVRVVAEGAVVDILLQPQPDVAIASLRLPSLLVQIKLQSSITNRFMIRFDHGFQRGGG